METIFGIDLGTTNSCISWINNGVPETISIQGSALVPSVVSFDDQEAIVGARARNRAVLHPEVTVSSVKRFMGSDQTFSITGREYTPQEISAYILSHLKTHAEQACGQQVRHVVITVPAYFSDAQRRATYKAGELAGLQVERIINEPTAAALFYTHILSSQLSENTLKKVLVYDLGGGTFDVSILRMGDLTEVLASSGNTQLGGDDFDQVLINRLLQEIVSTYGIDLSNYRPALSRLKSIAEQAKINLSNQPFTTIAEALIPNADNQNIDLHLELSRTEFEEMISPYLHSTQEELQQAISESHIQAQSLDNILLVGGSTRIPAVIGLLEAQFGAARMPLVDPDLSVAKGAAIQGGIISGSHIQQVLIDITPHTLSTEALTDKWTMQLECVPIIARNTQIPVTRSEVFYTSTDDQHKARIKVYQGESKDAEHNSLIGALDLMLAPCPINTPVLVEYSYDLNGIIHVKVEQKGFSRKREVDLDSSKQGQLFLEHDFEQAEWADSTEEDADIEPSPEQQRQITNYILHKARKVLNNLKDQGQYNTLQTLIEDYEQALAADNEDAVDETEERLVDFLDELEDKGA